MRTPEGPPLRSLTPGIVDTWLQAVARRPLTVEERRNVPLIGYRGARGVQDFTLFGYQVKSRVPAEFEAFRWTLKIAADIEGEALLGTPVEILPESIPPMTDRLHLIQVLTGEIHVSARGGQQVFGPDDFCVLGADESPRITTAGITSAFYINFPRTLLDIDLNAQLEPSRLIAVLEFARAVLVERLRHPLVGENNFTLLKFLLATPTTAATTPQPPGSASARTVRDQAALLIEQHHQDPAFDVDALAGLLHLSRRQLYRHFQGAELTVSEEIAEARANTARALIQEHLDLPLHSIATLSGFASESQFTRIFLRVHKVSPTHFRSSQLGR